MKRRDLEKQVESAGWHLERSTGKHDVYWKEGAARPLTIPRHKEIPERTAMEILRQAGVKRD